LRSNMQDLRDPAWVALLQRLRRLILAPLLALSTALSVRRGQANRSVIV
jgi:hypothetical protein